MRRLNEGILRSFCKYSEFTEVPDIFALWSGIGMMSAVLGRNVFINMGHFKIFPNQYIVLVAGSARCRKSTSIMLASDFIKAVTPPVKVYSQKMTPEALIAGLSTPKAEDDTIVIGNSAEGVIIVDELSTLIDKNAFSSGMIPLLTTLYDAHDSFSYATRGRGIETISQSCVSVLGASTEQWIREAIPVVAIGGGFTSRVVFVYKCRSDKYIARPIITPENKKRAEDIIHDLNEVARVRGEMDLTPEAWTLYEEEYKAFKEKSALFDNQYLQGYANRRHVTMLKTAMCVSVSERDSRLIDLKDVQIAINIMTNAEEDMHKVMNAITAGPSGETREEVLFFVKKNEQVARARLLRAFSHKMTARDLDVVVETLMGENYIRSMEKKNAIWYEYIGGDFTENVLKGKVE